MKTKYVWVVLLALTFFGCDDNTGTVGLNMFPDSDKNVNGRLSTFDVVTNSVAAGRIYAKTSVGYVGKFTDATFGTYKAGFLTEFYCPANYTFPEQFQAYNAKGEKVAPDSPDRVRGTGYRVNDIVHAADIILFYSSYFGDSLTPCRLSAYELDKKINRNEAYYTDIDPSKYYKEKDLLARKAYTAVDLSVSESRRKEKDYYPSVYLDIDKKIGQRIFDASLKAQKEGRDFSKEFGDLFKGIYVKSDYGDGTILYVDQMILQVAYPCYALDTIAKNGLPYKKKVEDEMGKVGADSIYYAARDFLATKEVIQANQLENDANKIQLLIDDPKWTYLKTPAGIFTQAELPLDDYTDKDGKKMEGIATKLNNDTLNAVKLTFTNYNQESDKKFGMTAPGFVLLVRAKDKYSFFEDNKLTDDITSYYAGHNSSVNQYAFDNMTKLVTTCLAERQSAIEEIAKSKKIDVQVRATDGKTETKTATTIEEWMEFTEWNKVELIPVLVKWDDPTSPTRNVISIQHDLKPGYVRLKGGNPKLAGNSLTLEIISTNFEGAAKK